MEVNKNRRSFLNLFRYRTDKNNNITAAVNSTTSLSIIKVQSLNQTIFEEAFCTIFSENETLSALYNIKCKLVSFSFDKTD